MADHNGPWKAKRVEGGVVIRGKNGKPVVIGSVATYALPVVVAAPDLLDTLQSYHDASEDHTYLDRKRRCRACRAIAKAEGREKP